ncbi:Protein jagged-1a [Mizuhopecten yessoensis]|uniref:Protein jagged-1a n=2 Tax=Mizuhopecten yessoensis TaxID=6573 RepID=A0A210PJI1_MIZYE|nr:Protein jagged-1a [Mizuhopecten yessoensis]
MAGGTVYIRFLSYSNPSHKDATGQCCESLSTSGCGANECDPFFKICVGLLSSSGCEYGSVKTEVYDNTDTIRFGNVIRTMPNPIVKTFNNWGSGIHVKVDVLDRDGTTFLGSDDLIGSVDHQITGPVDQNGILLHNTTKPIKGGAAELVIQYRIVCEQHYYGDCSVSCRPLLPKYNCSSSGQKLCLPGWVGFRCSIPDHSCVTKPCHNGGTCTDIPTNKYLCTCLNGWTGQTCETFALPPSTKTTIVTSKTSTQTAVTSSTPSTIQGAVTSSAQKLDTSTSQRQSMSTTQKRSTSTTKKALTLTTQEQTTSSTQGHNINNTLFSSTPQTVSQNVSSKTATSDTKSTSSWLVNSTSPEATTSNIATPTTPSQNTTGASCHFKMASSLINGTNITRVQLSGINRKELTAADVKRILEQTVHPTSLRPVSLDDSVMVFDMEITYNVSTITSKLLPRVQRELCRMETKVPGSATGREASEAGEASSDNSDNSDNSGPVIGGVLGALFLIAILGVAAFFLYRWNKKRNKVTGEKIDNECSSTSEIRNKISAKDVDISSPPASTHRQTDQPVSIASTQIQTDQPVNIAST